MPKIKKSKKPKFAYHLSVRINDAVWEADTNNLLEALKSYPVPPLIKTDAVIVATKGENKREEILNTAQARRVFLGSDTSLENLAADLAKALG